MQRARQLFRVNSLPSPRKGNNLLDSVDHPSYPLRGSKGKYPYVDGRHLIMVLEFYAYGDESGWQSESPFCLVSGYVGSPRQWEIFKQEWNGILGEYEVNAFHARRFFGRNRQGGRLDEYANWSDEKAIAFLDRLTAAIDRRDIRAIGCAVNTADFIALGKGERRYITGAGFRPWGFTLDTYEGVQWLASGGPSQPYYLAFQQCLMDGLAHVPREATVHFVFDHQNVLEDGAIKVFDDFKLHSPSEEGEPKVGRLSFGFASSEPEIQAADLFTYSVFSSLTREQDITPDRRRAFVALTRKRSGIPLANADSIEKAFFASMPDDLRDALRADPPRWPPPPGEWTHVP